MPFSSTAQDSPDRAGVSRASARSGLARTPVQTAAPAVSQSQGAPGNLYTTSIHVLVSATLKLSRKTRIPRGRKAFRGLGNMKLGTEWFAPDARGARSGVELGFMSTTLSRHVALEYSGARWGEVGTVLEFDVGAVDCGAQLDSLSQYPGSLVESCCW
jgi:hypothetical protein